MDHYIHELGSLQHRLNNLQEDVRALKQRGHPTPKLNEEVKWVKAKIRNVRKQLTTGHQNGQITGNDTRPSSATMSTIW